MGGWVGGGWVGGVGGGVWGDPKNAHDLFFSSHTLLTKLIGVGTEIAS